MKKFIFLTIFSIFSFFNVFAQSSFLDEPDYIEFIPIAKPKIVEQEPLQPNEEIIIKENEISNFVIENENPIEEISIETVKKDEKQDIQTPPEQQQITEPKSIQETTITTAEISPKTELVIPNDTISETEDYTAVEIAPFSEKELLENAQNFINQNDFEAAFLELQTYSNYYKDSDLSLFLTAQVLETKTDYQDIKKAVSLYQKLTETFPASAFWQKANQRKIYLEKFYLKI